MSLNFENIRYWHCTAGPDPLPLCAQELDEIKTGLENATDRSLFTLTGLLKEMEDGAFPWIVWHYYRSKNLFVVVLVESGLRIETQPVQPLVDELPRDHQYIRHLALDLNILKMSNARSAPIDNLDALAEFVDWLFRHQDKL